MGVDMREYNLFQERGKHCFIYRLKNGLLLKIFDAYPLKDWDNLENFKWVSFERLG